MRISIRIKMFFWIAALAVLFFLTTFLLNTTLFKPYYIERQRRSFLTLSEELSLLYEKDKMDFIDKVKASEYKEGFLIGLYSAEIGLLTSSSRAPGIMERPGNSPAPGGARPD